MNGSDECSGCPDCEDEERIDALAAKVRQLELDFEFLMAQLVTTNTRLAAIDERERRRELETSRGVGRRQ